VDGSHVEEVVAVADTEEAGGLLEGLGANAGDFVELGAGAEAAVLVAVGDDVESGAFGDAGDVAEQRPRGGIEVDTDTVYTAFDDRLERLLELTLVDVVLILADADGFGIDLDEF
jgi:hypothetical protein